MEQLHDEHLHNTGAEGGDDLRPGAAEQKGKAAAAHHARQQRDPGTVSRNGAGIAEGLFGAFHIQLARRHFPGDGVHRLHPAQMDTHPGHMAHGADGSVLPFGRSKDPVGEHIHMKVFDPQAVGHDLHGVLGAENLAAVFQHGFAGFHHQFNGAIGHALSPSAAGRRFSRANQTTASTAQTRVPARPTPAPG